MDTFQNLLQILSIFVVLKNIRVHFNHSGVFNVDTPFTYIVDVLAKSYHTSRSKDEIILYCV